MNNDEVCCGDDDERSSAPGLNTSGITAPAPIPAREGRAAANADLDLDAIEAAYRGFGYDHSANRLIRELRAARAEIARLKSGKPTEGTTA